MKLKEVKINIRDIISNFSLWFNHHKDTSARHCSKQVNVLTRVLWGRNWLLCSFYREGNFGPRWLNNFPTTTLIRGQSWHWNLGNLIPKPKLLPPALYSTPSSKPRSPHSLCYCTHPGRKYLKKLHIGKGIMTKRLRNTSTFISFIGKWAILFSLPWENSQRLLKNITRR